MVLLSRRWVWVLRALWLVLFAGRLWLYYVLWDFYVADPENWIGAMGRAAGSISMVLMFFVLGPLLLAPEIVPAFFFKVWNTPQKLQVLQDGYLLHIALILLWMYALAIPFDPSIAPRRAQGAIVTLAGAFFVFIYQSILLIRCRPLITAFTIDDQGVWAHGTKDLYGFMAFEDIKEIRVAEREVLRPCSLILFGKMTGKKFKVFSRQGYNESPQVLFR